MAFEKTLLAVPAQLLLTDGGKYGQVRIQSTLGYKLKQKVILESNTTTHKPLEVKAVLDTQNMILGPLTASLSDTADLTSYTLATNSTLRADPQDRQAIPPDKFWRAVFEESPTVAIRTFQVDSYGNPYTLDNPFPVDATLNVSELNVDIKNPGLPSIANVETGPADEEISFTFPVNTKRFQMKVRNGDAKLKIAFSAGDTEDNYFTNEMGNIFQSGDVDPAYPYTVYFRCSKANKVIEILSWANTP